MTLKPASFSKNLFFKISLIGILLFNSCREPCDGDSFFSWMDIYFAIIDRETDEYFFAVNYPEYKYSEFKIFDEKGNLQDKDYIHFFPDYTDTQYAMDQAVTKYYYFHYNEFDQDTMKVIIKGTYSDPCNYEIAEYIKIYYNNKIIYYDLYPAYGHHTENLKIYKEI